MEELKRFSRAQAFDEQPLLEHDSEALDFRAASKSFAPVRKLGTGTSRAMLEEEVLTLK